MKKLLIRGVVQREKGKMYFIDGKGDLYETTMQHKGRVKSSEPAQ